MTQEEKEILLKDLIARLPYGVKCAIKNSDGYHHENVAKIGETTIDKLKGFDGKYFNIYHDNPLDWDWSVSEVSVEDIKPYLFPRSSMTEEQIKEYESLCIKETSKCTDLYGIIFSKDYFYDTIESIDYLYKNHIDIRGLIPMGLAINCTNLNIY